MAGRLDVDGSASGAGMSSFVSLADEAGRQPQPAAPFGQRMLQSDTVWTLLTRLVFLEDRRHSPSLKEVLRGIEPVAAG
jgi:hypothetical protein